MIKNGRGLSSKVREHDLSDIASEMNVSVQLAKSRRIDQVRVAAHVRIRIAYHVSHCRTNFFEMIIPEGEDKGSRRSHLAFGIVQSAEQCCSRHDFGLWVKRSELE